ncbi:hypothetical protein B0H14DRAFT_2605669 [Mycena olivaceomarginata]|nr:hypothetical protein B0H14DRAFT_2605669 [Mycena olivaceomarginata]
MSVKLNFWLDSIQSSKLLCPFKYKCIIYSSIGPKLQSQESTILPHACLRGGCPAYGESEMYRQRTCFQQKPTQSAFLPSLERRWALSFSSSRLKTDFEVITLLLCGKFPSTQYLALAPERSEGSLVALIIYPD